MINNKNGFTLMELMVVVLIVAILAAIGLPQYFKVIEKQRGTEALGILAAINKAQERFFLINDRFTEDFTDLDLDFVELDTNPPAPPTGAVFNTRAFIFTLNGTDDDSGVVTAERRDNSYTLERRYETGVVCCTGEEDLCDLFPAVQMCEG